MQHLWCVVKAEWISRVQHSGERARAARHLADQSKQRATILFLSAEALLARFDELERRLLRSSVSQQSRRLMINRHITH